MLTTEGSNPAIQFLQSIPHLFSGEQNISFRSDILW